MCINRIRSTPGTVRAAIALLAVAVFVCGWMVVSAGAANSAPAFVQQVASHHANVSSLALTPSTNVTAGNRLVVVVGVWSGSSATAKSVTDSAGNAYVELLHFKASEGTELSVWTAPITAGGGTRPAITVKPSATADVGAAVSEYSGLSTAADASVLDASATATGTTGGAATVSSGTTPPTSTAGELALGMYVDSGFGDTLSAGSGWTQRSNVSNTSDVELLSEEQILSAAGATPNATAATGASTTWLMATVVLKPASAGSPTAPGAPANVTATAGNGQASVAWTAPSDGGSPITSYTITPYVGSTAQTPTTVTGSPPLTSATVTGLTNGTSYTFTVSATNAIGTSAQSAPSNAVTPATQSGGQWSALMSWPMVAIHSILLKNGNVLQFDGWQQPEPTQVWNPSSNTFTTQTAPDSIFCSGMAELPDGRVLVVGGYGGLSTGNIGIVDTNIFDPATQTWTRVADMHYPRWYPDLTELPDGRYVAISGNTTNESNWADTPEVYDPTQNTWTVLSKVSTAQVHDLEYPFSYLVPNGDVFTIGAGEDKSFLLDPNAQTWTQVGGASGVTLGSSVMYRPGKILYTGGAANLNSTSPARSTASVIDLTAPTPAWRSVAPMAYARIYHTLTMLADGTVLAVGGEPTAGQTGPTEVSGGVLPSEIWNPTTETWTTVASTGVTRGYHSTALLMPDGTVLVAGSGHANPGFAGQNSAQIYSPPYLFKGARPTITSAPAAATYGSTISVSTPDAASISSVNLVSLGADTHQSDMDQHFVPLSFTQGAGALNVRMPSSAATAPPGNYMLFIVNSNGVPSVAPIVNVAAAFTVPAAPTGAVAVAGNGNATVSWTAPDNGGSPITSYTITPYVGSTAQAPTTVTGSPPLTSATVSGLTNGTTYTFSVTATNAIGTSAASSPSNAVTPATSSGPVFIQSASAHASGVSSLTVTPSAGVALGDRLVVETGIWNAAGATAASVTDSAGNKYVELLHFKASEGTEMSVWTAPITAGGGTRPTITVKPTSAADVGVAVLEYAGLSPAADATVLDQTSHASGTTGAATTVASGATAATTASGELALGLYADSGFGDTLTAGAGFSSRVNVSNTPDMELLAEDQVVGAGATPNATVGTGKQTTWLMATVVLKANSLGAAADLASVRLLRARHHVRRHHRVVHRRHRTAHRRRHHRATDHAHRVNRRAARASEIRAAAIDVAARAEFVYEALLKHLGRNLFCFHGNSTLQPNWTGAWMRPTGTPRSSHL
jgi:hypothetical protein